MRTLLSQFACLRSLSLAALFQAFPYQRGVDYRRNVLRWVYPQYQTVRLLKGEPSLPNIADAVGSLRDFNVVQDEAFRCMDFNGRAIRHETINP